MSRPTVAMLAAKYEALDGAIQVLKDELVKANRRIEVLEDQNRIERELAIKASAGSNPVSKLRKPFAAKLNKRQAAAKELGKKLGRTFTREELDEYMASM